MPKQNSIRLRLEAGQVARLQELNAQLQQELEKQHFPLPATVGALKTALTEALDRQADFGAIWDKALTHAQTFRLSHPDAAIRNLPWQLACDDRELLSLVKSHTAEPATHAPAQGFPLKVLFMVSAPEGVTALNHEAEELRLLQALSPLMSRGLAQVHFTDDGSLENLEAKLRENHYHILHLSGHGAYEGGKGVLYLEDEATGRPRAVNAVEFNNVLAKAGRLGHRPELVLLSACQTAQGDRSGELGGVADTLLAAGQAAVVAMAASVLDDCATEFEALLYRQLAEGEPLPAAFQAAIHGLRMYEAKHDLKGRVPGQYLIPQLLTSAAVELLADPEKPRTELDFKADARYVTGDAALLELRGAERKNYNYVFLGRRRERRDAFGRLAEGKAVLLRGQGGVGKTALAEHLAVRMLAGNQRVKVFTHSEKSPSLKSLMDQICLYLSREKNLIAIEDDMKREERDTWEKQLKYLLQRLSDFCSPFFIFDNVESFQIKQDGEWCWDTSKHVDIQQGIQIIRKYTKYPVLLTGRYPVPELPELHIRDLNAVDFTDFFKKCWQLPLRALSKKLGAPADAAKTDGPEGARPVSFEDLARRLHRAFGGNYRALEFFDELHTQRGEAVFGTLERLDALEHTKTEVLRRMSENLVFGELLALLTSEENEALSLLARFRTPVLPMALGMQRDHRDLSPALDRLADLTLAERSTGHGAGATRYYMMPLVKDLLAEAGLPEASFSEKTAGDYHRYVVNEEISADALTDHSEAFEWYYAAGVEEEVNDVGYRLCRYFYDIQQFQLSLNYGLRTEDIAAGKTEQKIWVYIGLIFQLFGKWQTAFNYFEKSLTVYRAAGDRQGEGAVLNNISQIYDAKGDYDTALGYLQQSLKIAQEIGARQGEGVTLNNISQIYDAKGDYDTALDYLQQSLKIVHEIGDLRNEGGLLNNISQIYDAKGDYDTALDYLQQSLKIRQEIGDRKGEGATLNNLATTAHAKGDYDTALGYLQQSLKIRQEIGDRKGEGTTLNNISQIYDAKGDYDTALGYLQQSLKIAQEIGDLRNEGGLLNNMGALLFREDRLEAALPLFIQAYNIFKQIDSPNISVPESYLNEIIEKIGRERYEAILKAQI